MNQPIQNLLRIVGIKKHDRDKRVLTVESLELKSGERVNVYGSNGSGKSTLLKIIAGIDSFEKGSLLVGILFQEVQMGMYRSEEGSILS
jgi:ABC-type lipoprotein export system ATPase subunit